MSNLNMLFQDVTSIIRASGDHRKAAEATTALENFVEMKDDLKTRGEFDKESEEVVRHKLAFLGLDLTQYAAQAIAQLGERCLELAGASAVREVCKPILREGTGFDGKPLPPIPSGYVLPEQYDTVVSKLKAAIGR